MYVLYNILCISRRHINELSTTTQSTQCRVDSLCIYVYIIFYVYLNDISTTTHSTTTQSTHSIQSTTTQSTPACPSPSSTPWWPGDSEGPQAFLVLA